MPLVVVLEALEIPVDADDAEIAAKLRGLTGLAGQSLTPALWIRLLDYFTWEVHLRPPDRESPMAVLGFTVGSWCAVERDVRWNSETWLPELGITEWEPHDGSSERGALIAVRDRIERYVAGEIGPRLARQGLLRARPQERTEGSD